MKRKLTAAAAAFMSLCVVLTGSFCNAYAVRAETAGTEEASGASEDSGYHFVLEKSGVIFDLPEEFKSLKGVILPGYDMEAEPGSGLFVSSLTYCAFTREKYDEQVQKKEISEVDWDFVYPRMVDFLIIYTLDDGRSLEDLTPLLSEYGLPDKNIKELGSVGDYSFFYALDPYADALDTEFTFDEGFREDYDAAVKACGDLSWVQFQEPEGGVPTAEEGTGISFETTDLDGNAVNAADIFGAHKITMVNIWGTFCGPCINEMPDLEELNGRLGEKDCAIIGVVCDVAGKDDSAMIGTAKEIIADTGVTYLNLVPWESFAGDLPSQFVPTTYFIDSNGQVVGDAAIGARGADEYEALLDEVLGE